MKIHTYIFGIALCIQSFQLYSQGSFTEYSYSVSQDSLGEFVALVSGKKIRKFYENKIEGDLISGIIKDANGTYFYSAQTDLFELKDSEDKLLAIVNANKGKMLSVTIPDGYSYRLKKTAIKNWAFYLDDEPVLKLSYHTKDDIQYLKIETLQESLVGLEWIVLMAQLKGIEKIGRQKNIPALLIFSLIK